MTLTEYWDLLNVFDWYYDFSDDYRVFEAGNKRNHQLLEISKKSREHEKLYNRFREHFFSGSPWRTEKSAKPERPPEEREGA